ncbi:hypothetical protein ANO11243_092310 [Dothideomycetidae sp. 11243]|nr:hypothetical protein ANO11243_092310 [fungal sp. No.11243]
MNPITLLFLTAGALAAYKPCPVQTTDTFPLCCPNSVAGVDSGCIQRESAHTLSPHPPMSHLTLHSAPHYPTSLDDFEDECAELSLFAVCCATEDFGEATDCQAPLTN